MLGLKLHTCLETSELQSLTHKMDQPLLLSLLKTALQTLLTQKRFCNLRQSTLPANSTKIHVQIDLVHSITTAMCTSLKQLNRKTPHNPKTFPNLKIGRKSLQIPGRSQVKLMRFLIILRKLIQTWPGLQKASIRSQMLLHRDNSEKIMRLRIHTYLTDAYS